MRKIEFRYREIEKNCYEEFIKSKNSEDFMNLENYVCEHKDKIIKEKKIGSTTLFFEDEEVDTDSKGELKEKKIEELNLYEKKVNWGEYTGYLHKGEEEKHICYLYKMYIKIKTKKEIILEEVAKSFNIKDLESKGIKDTMLASLYTDKEGSNWKYKIEFLAGYVANNYSNSTVKQYLTIFNKTKSLEEYYKKDLYDFTASEMRAFLKLLRAKTYNAITSKYSLIKNYIEIAKTDKQGIIDVPSGMLLKAGDLNELIFDYAQENRYCTRTQLEEGVRNIENPIDQAIYLLLFEGIMGKEYEDLRLLKKSDIDLKKREVLRLSTGEKIKISSFTAEVLEEAMYQEHYYRENSTIKTKLDLSSPYLIKTKLTSTSNGEYLKYTGLTRRLDILKDKMGMPLLTAKTVYRSGLIEKVLIFEHENKVELNIKEIKDLMNEWGELKEGADFYKAKKILEKDMLEDLNNRNFEIE